MNGDSPYQNINAIFISHAHGDHFAADDTLKYMMRHRNVELFAPAQAVAQLIAHEDYDKISPRINTIKLEFGDKAAQVSSAGLTVDAVRIPHAGWPGRADVENIVFRVTLKSGLTVMHLGDADVNVEHYIPYRDHWRSTTTELGFPPYWFFYSLEGRDILSYYMQVHEAVGVHVPTKVPEFLDAKGYLYFSTPGQWHAIHTH